MQARIRSPVVRLFFCVIGRARSASRSASYWASAKEGGGNLLSLLVIAAAALLLLTSCGGSSSGPDITKIAAALAAGALASRKAKAGPQFLHYIEQRVKYLIGKNSGWASESGHTSLATRLGSEMDQVAQVVTDRVTAFGGTDPDTPHHRDLDDAAKRLTTDGPSVIATRAAQYKRDRRERVAQIVWRACAVQPELWAGGDATLSPTLQKLPLTEVLDRRLHAIEFMFLHDQGDFGAWSIASAGSNWKDKQRTSMFQYPFLNDTADFDAALTASGLTVASLAPDWTPEDPAHFTPGAGGTLNYRLQGRVRPAAAAGWAFDPAAYRFRLTGSVPAADAFEAMIPIAPTMDSAFEDFWQRNWMFCDHMIALLHVQGLRFGRLRRTHSDADFNAAAGAGVTLVPLIPKTGPPSPLWLMANGLQWFDGIEIPPEELQVGDHLVYWNNQFVRHILGSAFGLENSLVTRIMPDGRSAMLAGHGMPESSASKFSEDMSGEIKTSYTKLRTFLIQKVSADPSVGFVPLQLRGVRFQLVRWDPFGENFKPSGAGQMNVKGAWWIRLRRDQLRDSNEAVPTMSEALAMIPKAVRVDTSVHTQMPDFPPGLPRPFKPDPDFQESIYMPLSLPKGVKGGWVTYFAHPKPGATVDLDDLIPDGTMVPGFHVKGPNSTVPVLRPKVVP